MSEREPHFKNMTPSGFCKKCGMAMISIGEQPTCPACKPSESNPSGIINTLQDPGEEVLKLALATPDDVLLPKEITGKVMEKGATVVFGPKYPAIKGASKLSTDDLLDALYEELHKTPVNSLSHAKKLLKLKKEVLDLKNKIKLFLEI